MASNINITNIDVTYPIAGQDNDTQGFRTNFTNIKNNFVTAAGEITRLQGNVGHLQQFGASSHATIIASGSTQTGATPVATQTVTVNSISSAQGVVLPAPIQAGQLIYINSGANGVSVYPSASGRIDSLPINGALILSPFITWTVMCESVTPNIMWKSIAGGIVGSGNNQIVTSYLNGSTSIGLSDNLITPGSLTVTGNLFTTNDILWANGVSYSSTIVSNYGNANVAAYLSGNIIANLTASIDTSIAANVLTSFTGNLTAGNVAVSGTIYGNLTGTASNSITSQTAEVASLVSGLTSANVTTALGFVPYDSTNPASYITNSALPANVSQLNNDLGYITANANLTSASGLPLTTGVVGILAAAKGGTGLTVPGTSGNVLTSNGTTWVSVAAATGSGGSFTYPAAGIPVSSGTSWTTPFTNANPVSVLFGGTGANTFATNALLTGNGTGPFQAITPVGFNGFVLASNGFAWAPANLATTYYPYSTNPSGYLTAITSGQITGALGYTPYNSSNPGGYLSASNVLPTGVIVMWAGSSASVPSGWYLCNGTNGTPNLIDRFVVGAGGTYAVSATGGTADAVVVSHTHTATSTDSGHNHTFTTGAGTDTVSGGPIPINTNVSSTTATTNTGNANITTTIATAGVSGVGQNLPPYYALCYIMKA